MDLHLSFTLDVPTGWSRRILHHVLVTVGVVAGMTTAVWAYDTSWIASGQPLSAAALKDDLDEIQSRLEVLEAREPVYRATLGSSGELVADSGPASTFGLSSGMKAVTCPSRALPMRMPRFHSPCLRDVFDSESAT